jgi:hypothetical protein
MCFVVHILYCWVEFLHIFLVVLLYFGYFCCCNFWDSPFYSHQNAQICFELTGINAFMIFLWNIFGFLFRRNVFR